MKRYIVRMATVDWVYSYHVVEIESLNDLKWACHKLLRENPGKVLVDFESQGPDL